MGFLRNSLIFLVIITISISGNSQEHRWFKRFNTTTFLTNGAIYSSPVATANDHVVLGSHNKKIYFFDGQGKLLNTFKTKGWIHATPKGLKDNTISLRSYDGFIYFFDNLGNLIRKIKPGGSIFTDQVSQVIEKIDKPIIRTK